MGNLNVVVETRGSVQVKRCDVILVIDLKCETWRRRFNALSNHFRPHSRRLGHSQPVAGDSSERKLHANISFVAVPRMWKGEVYRRSCHVAAAEWVHVTVMNEANLP